MESRLTLTDAVLAELTARAKLNKPSSQWKTAEWDRAVDAVVLAMKQPLPNERLTGKYT